MGIRTDNMKEFMKDPKKRNVYIFLIVVAFVVILMGLWLASKKGIKPQTGANVAAIPSINATPGVSDSPQYNLEVEKQNRLEGQAALDKNKSHMPVPVNSGVSGTSPLDEIEKQALAKKKQAEDEQRIKDEEEERSRLAAIEEAQKRAAEEEAQRLERERLAAQQYQPNQVVKNHAGGAGKYSNQNDYNLISTLLSSGNWGVRQSKSEFDYTKGKDSINKPQGNQYAQNDNQVANYSNNSQQGQQVEIVDKAGSIHAAILETAINSDEPSPILAKIVSGPLKGARAIGTMTRTGEKVLVEFNTFSLSSQKTSMKTRAVAIDANTARTSLASDVDHHYFLKYGVLLASTFLGGYSDAIARQNTTTTVTNGQVVSQQGQLSAEDINKQALGAVGKELAEQTKAQIRGIQPTITVNAGTAIGILLMEDLTIKK